MVSTTLSWPRRLLPRLSTAVALVLGALVGAAALATIQAYGLVSPPPVRGSGGTYADEDVVLTLREAYLGRIAADHVAAVPTLVPVENIRLNVLPGQRLRVFGDVAFFGQRWQLSALMTVGVVDRRVRLQTQEVQVGTLVLPIDVDGIVAEPINRELDALIEENQFDVIEVATTTDRLVVRLAAR